MVVYGDREHFANLAWMTGFDPRFEEALLVVGGEGEPLLLVGNECMGYIPASPARCLLRVERYPLFSLPSQPVGEHRRLEEIFREAGIRAGSRLGLSGLKPSADEYRLDAPAYIADALRALAGAAGVFNAAGFFVDEETGVRTTVTPGEALYFEWTNTLATDGMKRILHAIRPGMLDYELLELARYSGVPLGCHMTLKCGGNRVSLASARGERIEEGGRFSCGICYWGANCCRCGWVKEDWPEYVEDFAAPYFEAMAAWFAELKPGGTGGALYEAVHSRLAEERFHVFLNAGHLIGLDEWVSSPVWEGSQAPLRAGMVMQADVIPSNPIYYSTRMEDGYLLWGESSELDCRFVERAGMRREFMRSRLGLPVDKQVYPLGNMPGIVAPLVLAPQRILAR